MGKDPFGKLERVLLKHGQGFYWNVGKSPFDTLEVRSFWNIRTEPFETLETGSFETLETGSFETLETGSIETLETGSFETLERVIKKHGKGFWAAREKSIRNMKKCPLEHGEYSLKTWEKLEVRGKNEHSIRKTQL
jgi:hypothetical protein